MRHVRGAATKIRGLLVDLADLESVVSDLRYQRHRLVEGLMYRDDWDCLPELVVIQAELQEKTQSLQALLEKYQALIK